MSVRILDPCPPRNTRVVAPAARLETLDGVTLGLVHNGKTHGMELMEFVVDELRTRWAIAGVRRTRIPITTPPSPEQIERIGSECLAVLSAIGD